MRLPLRTIFAMACAIFAATAIAQDPPPVQPEVKPAESPAAQTPAAQTPAAQVAPVPSKKGAKPAKGSKETSKEPPAGVTPYVVGALDVLDIRVWNDPKLSGMFDVRPDGIISMPLIGELKADGLSVPDLTALIKTRLSTVLNAPEVNIQVARINSKKFFIIGGVNRQGEFPLTGPIRVLDALANCGGFKDFANPKKIYVLRGGKRFEFNYKDVSHGKNMEQNILVQNDDHIFVPE